MLKKLLIGLGVVGLIAVVAVVALVKEFADTDKNMANAVLTITDLQAMLGSLPDGEYKGGFHPGKFVGAEVKVVVRDHKIASIELLEHNNGKGKPAEVLPARVVETQSLGVELVSGATSSSKVILKAIENALLSKAGGK